MRSDQHAQEKLYRYIATISSNKLLLEVNDGITYRGEIDIPSYVEINELKALFEKGEVQILNKTTSKVIIKLAFLKIELLSEETHQIRELKERIEVLENRLEAAGIWVQEDLNSTNGFDMNYIYKIYHNGGTSCSSTSVSPANIFFFSGATNLNVGNQNRRAVSNGWVVSKIMKRKV